MMTCRRMLQQLRIDDDDDVGDVGDDDDDEEEQEDLQQDASTQEGFVWPEISGGQATTQSPHIRLIKRENFNKELFN